MGVLRSPHIQDYGNPLCGTLRSQRIAIGLMEATRLVRKQPPSGSG